MHFPVSCLAKLISSLIVLSLKHRNQLGGLDALSISPFLVIDDNTIKASQMIFNTVLNLEIYEKPPPKNVHFYLEFQKWSKHAICTYSIRIMKLPLYLSIHGVQNQCEVIYVMHMTEVVTQENKRI
jgi:hypothetical protein